MLDTIINDNLQKRISEFRQNIHKYPEVGWTEFRTASLVAKRLDELGFIVQSGRGVIRESDRMGVPDEDELEFHYQRAISQGADLKYLEPLKGGFTGVVGTIYLGEGPVVAFRFDMDALKITETDDPEHLPNRKQFASLNKGVMHACGHDGHTSMGIGLAEVLSKGKEHFNNIGRIKLIFQPAEEGVRGANAMAGSGILDDVDYIFGGHLMSTEPIGTLTCASNGFLATSKIDVTYKGKAAHAGGTPDEGKNSLLAACTAVLNLYSIARHKEGASRINVGKLVSGSDRNIISEDTFFQLETRGETSSINEYMEANALRIIEHAAKMYEVDYKTAYMGAALSGHCDDDLVEQIYGEAQKSGIYSTINKKTDKVMGSEDYTCMLGEVQKNGGKGSFLLFGSGPAGGAHTSDYDMNEKALLDAVRFYSHLLQSLYKN